MTHSPRVDASMIYGPAMGYRGRGTERVSLPPLVLMQSAGESEHVWVWGTVTLVLSLGLLAFTPLSPAWELTLPSRDPSPLGESCSDYSGCELWV